MDVLKRPSAFLPLVMSLVIVAAGAREAAMFGTLRQPDEGAAAHLFQLLMPLEVPIIAFFGITWLPRAPRQALAVLALQIGAGVAIFAGVCFLT